MWTSVGGAGDGVRATTCLPLPFAGSPASTAGVSSDSEVSMLGSAGVRRSDKLPLRDVGWDRAREMVRRTWTSGRRRVRADGLALAAFGLDLRLRCQRGIGLYQGQMKQDELSAGAALALRSSRQVVVRSSVERRTYPRRPSSSLARARRLGPPRRPQSPCAAASAWPLRRRHELSVACCVSTEGEGRC
jgi:hypothetical protein